MAIYHETDQWELVSGQEHMLNDVSFDIKKVVLSDGGFLGFRVVEHLDVYFVGIMTYKNEMNEHEIHTVESLFFNGKF